MRTLSPFLALYATAVWMLPFCLAGQGESEAKARKALEPRTVTFSQPSLPLDKALAELMAKTGNRVADSRKLMTNPDLPLPKDPLTFWQALDGIGKSSGVGFTVYAEGGVALIDTPYRPVSTAYAGIFRIATRRVAVERDEQTQARQCKLAFDVAWEPRFQPFYVDLRDVKLTYAPDAKQKQLVDDVRGKGRIPVAGRSAIELDVHARAAERTSPKIASLEGTVWALGPSKMLHFAFDKLKPGAKDTIEGVTVTLVAIKRQTDVLRIRVRIENPKGTIQFDSHESAWLDNNRITLIREVGGKQRVLMSSSSNEDSREWPQAQMEYHFTETATQALPPALDGWTLVYETPGRIVEVTAKFRLENLALP